MSTDSGVARLVIERMKANGEYGTLSDEQPCKLFHVNYDVDKDADEAAIKAILAQIPGGSKIGALPMPDGIAGLIMTDGNISCRVLSIGDALHAKRWRRVDLIYAD